ncbi:hypothetical protein [Kitasatospora sp. HPMI-4]|uniref:hypothetical protein n=1 Tax=Kitasatospora sp. HPMI-4 TaxID=3448443 RepID=UPI003F1B47F9
MLEQAGIQPGTRVPEIGSGGLDAEMIAELVGEVGELTTIEIDPDVTGRAVPGCGQPSAELAEPRNAPWCRPDLGLSGLRRWL